jgi:hypothetical protein
MNAMSNATFLEGSLTDNLDSVVDFTNIMETSSTNNITREVGITAGKKNEFMSDGFFNPLEDT